MAEKGTLRTGAFLAFLGVIVLVVSTLYHASKAHPGDTHAAFEDYATSDPWIASHLGQFIGTILVLGALVALYQAMSKSSQPSSVSLLARFGLAGAVVSAAVFAILQAVDGVTLKFVVDSWAAAPESEKATAYRVAEAVRWTEIGIHSYFRVTIGITIALYGLAIAFGAGFPRWSRLFAAATLLAGIAQFAQGVGVGYNGFTVPDAPPALWTTVSIFVGPLFVLWVLALGFFLFLHSTQASAAPHPAIQASVQTGA
jgi:hypothetical protein